MKHLNPSGAKFKLHDLITILPGYYTNLDNNTPIQQSYDGIITNIEVKQWKKGETPELCYDILFEDGSEWFHTTESIDKKAKLKHARATTVYKNAQKAFLGKIRGPLQAHAQYMMEILGFKSAEPPPKSLRRSTRKKNTSSNSKTRKQKK